jgi:hypothetical protein
MRSHAYNYQPAELARLLAGPLLVASFILGAMHVSARLGLLPPPRPTLDTDRTILIHQAEAARARHDALVLLVGDSSCLMDVNARQLSNELGARTLNLGTLSFLDLAQYAALVRQYVAANPDRLRAVVLMMNPEALRRVGAENYYAGVLNSFWAGEDFCRTATLEDRLACWLGLELFRGRILSRTLPIPLGGAFGRRYGFSRDLERFMNRENGSVIDPVFEELHGPTEDRLSPTLKLASQQFRAAVPRTAKLLVGITPIPSRSAGTNYAEANRDMLQQWAGWLQADGVLDKLPMTQPDERFARPAHLNERAVPVYTTEVANSLRAFVSR